jgi:membrane protease YdiL (CAAX protease family)
MKNPPLTLSLTTLIVAAILWYFLFQTRVANFWLMLTVATMILLSLSIWLNGGTGIWSTLTFRNIGIGVSSGVLLYLFFLVSYEIVKGLDFMTGGVQGVYDLGVDTPIFYVAILLLFPISPGEEIYWRGLIQRSLQQHVSPMISWLLTTAVYTGVHLPTLNPPLLITAFVGGLVWGFIFMRTKSVTAGLISHTVFNTMIFVLLPLGA